MFSISGLTRSCMSRWPSSSLAFSSHFHPPSLFNRALIRAYGTGHSKSLSGRTEKLDIKEKSPVMVPLGTQRVYVPSDRQAENWGKMVALVDEYVSLDPQDKKLKLMTLSIEKFSRSRGIPTLRGDSEEDLDQVHLWVNSEAEKSGIAPVTQYFPNKKVDVISSVIATVNKCFAIEEFQSQVRVQSVSEYFWDVRQRSEYIFPFTSDSDELHTMVEMGLPLLNRSTLYHEVGIGSGEGILEMIRRGVKENRVPGCIVGTDINKYSLESLKLLIEDGFGGMENVFLRHANAVEPINMQQLGFTPNVFVMAANRFFSILDPNVFSSVVRAFSKQIQGEGYLVVGVNTNSPENMEMLEMYEGNPDYHVEDTGLGKVLYENNPFAEQMKRRGLSAHDLVKIIHKETGLPEKEIDISRIVLQVFYDPERFIERVEREHFTTLDRRVVKENTSRLVILFKKKQS